MSTELILADRTAVERYDCLVHCAWLDVMGKNGKFFGAEFEF